MINNVVMLILTIHLKMSIGGIFVRNLPEAMKPYARKLEKNNNHFKLGKLGLYEYVTRQHELCTKVITWYRNDRRDTGEDDVEVSVYINTIWDLTKGAKT